MTTKTTMTDPVQPRKQVSSKTELTIPRLHLAPSFVISCGTITLDIEERKILLIRWLTTNEILFAKGRKDIGATLEATAVRETYEETGLRATLLPTSAPTRQTWSREHRARIEKAENASLPTTTPAGDVDPAQLHTEAIAVHQRITSEGVLKIIFWYIAEGDSTAVPDEDTKEADEDFENIWADWDAIDSTLTFEDDRVLAKYVLDIVATKV
jgi:8-oxo-dGTP pyrophosphatase MutT (NUDIX family)